ncbi:MAG: hypothetical protein GY822_03340 [Deltaproteobacteria bacterium]|nr:hypothetical protein [Deltaproteobacteria bacterium]
MADFIKQAQFPYLSATIRPKEGPLFEISVPQEELDKASPWARLIPGKIAPRTRICVDGALVEDAGVTTCKGTTIGLIGATTERLRLLSNISPSLEVDDTIEKILMSVQKQVDALRRDGVEIILLLSHLQNIQKELKLVELGLHGVDVIIASGGDNRLSNSAHRLFDADEPDPICREEKSCYPLMRLAQDARPVLLVATDGQLKYVGQLNISFDAQGVLTGVADSRSKPWPVDEVSLLELHAEPNRDALAFEEEVRSYLAPLMTPFARSKIFFNGTRESVRNRETNLGNLAADAMMWASKTESAPENVGDDGKPEVDTSPALETKSEDLPLFSLRNAGGIRNAIGTVNARTFKREGSFLRPLDVQSSLRFNNPLVVVEVTHQNLRQTFESALRGVGTARGSFPQVSQNVALEYVRDAAEQTHVTENGNITELGCVGGRVRTSIVSFDDGSKRRIVEKGVTQAPQKRIRFTTLAYLAKGGDSYFPANVDDVRIVRKLAATEQSSFTDFILHLEKAGVWQGGIRYVDPVPGRRDTFHRIVDLGKTNTPTDKSCE